MIQFLNFGFDNYDKFPLLEGGVGGLELRTKQAARRKPRATGMNQTRLIRGTSAGWVTSTGVMNWGRNF